MISITQLQSAKCFLNVKRLHSKMASSYDKKKYHLYSQYRRRYIDDKYNLDLTYITKQIIAMSFPESGIKTIVKNSIDDVEQFLEDKHKDTYLVINLTNQQYDRNGRFNGRVLQFPFPDHTAPRMIPSYDLVCLIATYIQEKPTNVVAIHCKAGKGRTGSIICALLLYMNPESLADDIIKFFGEQRSHDGLGLENICQIRYVKQFEIARNADYKMFTNDNFSTRLTIHQAQIQHNDDFVVAKISIIYYLDNRNSKRCLNFINKGGDNSYNPYYQTSMKHDFYVIMEVGKKRKQVVAQLNTNFLSPYLFQQGKQTILQLTNADFDYLKDAKVQNKVFKIIFKVTLEVT